MLLREHEQCSIVSQIQRVRVCVPCIAYARIEPGSVACK